MKQTFSIISILFVFLAFTSCGGNNNGSSDDQQVVMNVDQLLDNADMLVDSLVTFEGVCSHTCKHGATKMFILGTGPSKIIRVEACDLGRFDNKVVHQPVKVTGHLREQRIDEDYLSAWESRIAEADEAEYTKQANGSCDSEMAIRGVVSNTADGQIAEYRARIAERDSVEGKPYLSFFYVDAVSYELAGDDQ